MERPKDASRLWFDRSKPFYPIVMNLWYQFHGFNDLLSRGLMRKASHLSRESVDGLVRSVAIKRPERIRQIVNSHPVPLLLDFNLRCKMDPRGIEVDPNELAEEVLQEGAYLGPYLVRAAGAALITADAVANEPRRRESPTWEFLHHGRNAAAHGDRFTFRNGEPKRRAKWRGLSITRKREGTPLFDGTPAEGLLLPGDVLRLLNDLEPSANPTAQ